MLALTNGQILIVWIIALCFTIIYCASYIRKHDTKPKLGPRDKDRLMEELRRHEED